MEYDEYGNEKDEMWYLIDEIEKQNLDFQQVRELLESNGLKNEKNNQKLDAFIEKVIASFMEQNKIDYEYYDSIYMHFFDTYIDFEEYYNTFVERINENDINVTGDDIAKAIEYIKKGNLCCAAEIGSYLLNGQYESNVSVEKQTLMSEHPNQNLIKGVPLDYTLVVQFVNSYKEKLDQELTSRELTKMEVIGVLGPDTFSETNGKKYSPTQAVYGYSIATINNDPDFLIQESLKDIGLENIVFSKEANKRLFAVKDTKFGYHSMNSGHWISRANVMSDESVKEFITSTGIQYNDIIEENINTVHM